jgi:hypothetical protein
MCAARCRVAANVASFCTFMPLVTALTGARDRSAPAPLPPPHTHTHSLPPRAPPAPAHGSRRVFPRPAHQERISTRVSVERFRDRLQQARIVAEELRVQASTAASEASETRSKFLRVAKKMTVPARLRANVRVQVQQEEAAALQGRGA